MPFTDLANDGWTPVGSGPVLDRVRQNSAVEALGNRVPMSTDAIVLPTLGDTGVDIVAKGATIPLLDPAVGSSTMTAVKWADRFAQSVEDDADSVVSFFERARLNWFGNWSVEFDNAALGVTAAAVGAGVPFVSAYAVAAANGGLIQTAGTPTFEDFSDALARLETGAYYNPNDIVVVASPGFKGTLRNLKDAAGDSVVTEPLGGGTPSIFGYDLVFSSGAKTSATATHAPTGNDLVVIANRQHLLVGVRSGPEFKVSDEEQWANDVIEMKVRVRRGFAAPTPGAISVIERTAAPTV